MTKREAFKYICKCVAELLDPKNGHDNGFLEEVPNGEECSADDYRRNKDALLQLCEELYRRSK